MSSTDVYLEFSLTNAHIFPLLQLHRNVFRDCDLDAVVRLGSRAGEAFRFVLSTERGCGIQIRVHTKSQLCVISEFEYQLCF